MRERRGLSALLRSAAKDASFSSASKVLITFEREGILQFPMQINQGSERPRKGGLLALHGEKHDSRRLDSCASMRGPMG